MLYYTIPAVAPVYLKLMIGVFIHIATKGSEL